MPQGGQDRPVDPKGQEIERYYKDIQDCPGPDPKVRDVKQKYVKYAERALQHEVHVQSQQFQRRASFEQWCDENEREWHSMDTLFRRRLIAHYSKMPDELPARLEYPFAIAGQQLRDSGETLLGDENKWKKIVPRGAAQAEHILTQVVHPLEFPPRMRIIYFTPIFGSDSSFSGKAWQKIEPLNDVDVWAVSWQGWTDFDAMINAVARAIRSFADSVSNIFYGHSMGGIVAYEVIKRLETVSTPHRPSAFVVSACPAPHLFPHQYNSTAFDWLNRITKIDQFNNLTSEQHFELQREHGVAYMFPHMGQLERKVSAHPGLADIVAQERPSEMWLHDDTKQQIINDLKCMKSYESWRKTNHSARSHEALKVHLPLYVIGAPNDDFVDDADMEAWSRYAKSDFEFEMLEGSSKEDQIDMDERLHVFAQWGVKPLLEKLTSIMLKHELPDKMSNLPDVGPTNKPLPDFIECVVIGAGIGGVNQMRHLAEHKIDAICVEMRDVIGGVWVHYGNTYSRVNTSEAAYRIVDQGEGPMVRTNEDHAPKWDMVFDIYAVAAKHSYGRFHCLWENKKVVKNDSGKGRYQLTFVHKETGQTSVVKSDGVVFAVNRRIGQKRWITWPDEDKFRGESYYGFGNEVKNVDWHNKKVLVVGCGAFAFENMRTALEHGARHASMICRRRGTVCPKFIDIVTFYRPFDAEFRHPQAGDIVTFSVWNQLYLDANAVQPECWKEGLLKPNGHTVSVSDVFYQASRLGMADCNITEIRKFRPDGHGAIMTDGTSVDFDVIIKCTGFHLNKDVVKITGQQKMHSMGFMDVNMFYTAEPLLDAAQFGSPFGSSYIGGMTSNVKMFAKFFRHAEFQEQMFPLMLKECPVDEAWASHMIGKGVVFKDESKDTKSRALPSPHP